MREIFIERTEELLRIAIKENERLAECFIEEDDDRIYPGQIYKGVIKNIVPAIKCAFVDIGCEKNAYLYLDNKFSNSGFKKGQEIIVEVIKEDIDHKGAKVTSSFSIPGRYSVLMTLNRELSFSSKITDKEYKKILQQEIQKPDEVGVMIRTNASAVSTEEINSEINKLYSIYKKIIREAAYSTKCGLLYSDEGILDRVLRDNIDDNTGKIIVDNYDDFTHIKEYITGKPDIQAGTELYDGHRSLFDFYSIEKEILGLRNNRVNLSCGGYIVIDKTEAMYVIDVNSGKNVSQSAIQKTAAVTNSQAAAEIASQIRLRNLSGIILVDFIDIKAEEVKAEILGILEKGFKGDKNKTVIYPFTELNLVQIARRRRGRNIYEYIEEECRECHGRGKKLRLSYICKLIKNEICKGDIEDKIKNIYIEVNELYKASINGDIFQFVKEIGGMDKTVYLKFSDTVEYFTVEPLIFMNQIQNVEKYKIYG